MTKKLLPPDLIILHDNDWLERQRIAGKIVAKCLSRAKLLIENKTPNLSLKDIESECVKIINDNNCAPTFLNYRGFPGAICTSVNKVIVHGIPTNYKLKDGDIVKIDVGATYQDAIGDAAITAIYSNSLSPAHEKIVKVCKEALYNGIKAIKVGNRIDQISSAIYNTVKNAGLKVITAYGGHGISNNGQLHASPFISNKPEDYGITIQPGLTITLEPMVTYGNNRTKVGRDGWSVITSNMNAHWENSLYVHKDHVEIITELDNEIRV